MGLFFFYYRSTSILNFFFFSSRRRHTRWPRDWSSDVCSSDLLAPALALDDEKRLDQVVGGEARLAREAAREWVAAHAPHARTGKPSCGSPTHRGSWRGSSCGRFARGPGITSDYGRSLYMNRGNGETDRRRRFSTLCES